jgi:predicted aspartyl protease
VPHLTLQISPQGPIPDVAIGVSEGRRAALTAAGQPIPAFLPIRVLIDTGASCSCIDPSIITQLNITPTSVVPILTPSTSNTAVDKDQYDVSLVLVQTSVGAIRTFNSVPVVEAHLFAGQGIHGLIGRDILEKCLLIYDGQTKIFTLSF